MNDIMIDLETLSTSNRARILSIGAVAFDRETGALGKSFYCSLEPPLHSVEKNILVDDATVKWWDKQSDEAKQALSLNRFGYATGLDKFLIFMRHFNTSKIKVWANDPTFDCAILSHSLSAHNFVTPWKFYNERSCRTMKDLSQHFFGDENYGIENNSKHHALEDAIYQAKLVMAIFNKMEAPLCQTK